MGTIAHQIGQYALHAPFATGGMATLHLARRSGPGGFGRTVVVKRLHPQYAHDADFVAMLLDEARLVARVHHPNVVAVTDVLHDGGELLLVLEYVHGLSVAELVTAEARPSAAVASALVSAVLEGLHAAHEATHENGAPLRIVHRDVSPQNVMVGTDGVARVLDFGVAKATLRIQATRHGERKGKVGYMAPEQLARGDVDRRADVYAAGVVLWELLAGRRLFPTDDEGQTPPRDHVPPTGTDDDALGAVVRRALAPDPDARFSTAREMADALRAACPPAAASQVAAWVEDAGGEALRERSARLAALERASVQALADETTAPTGPADRPSRRVPGAMKSAPKRRHPLPTAARASHSSRFLELERQHLDALKKALGLSPPLPAERRRLLGLRAQLVSDDELEILASLADSHDGAVLGIPLDLDQVREALAYGRASASFEHHVEALLLSCQDERLRRRAAVAEPANVIRRAVKAVAGSPHGASMAAEAARLRALRTGVRKKRKPAPG